MPAGMAAGSMWRAPRGVCRELGRAMGTPSPVILTVTVIPPSLVQDAVGGFLYLTDRRSYMIISGGVNIYPQETENILSAHPAVQVVAVIGVPNDDFGEEVKAVVQLADPDAAGAELAGELIAFCRDRLAHFKCPRTVDFVPELPRSETGKLYKRILRDAYWAGHSSSIV
jgi:long-chain acyl-CoA synthetase